MQGSSKAYEARANLSDEAAAILAPRGPGMGVLGKARSLAVPSLFPPPPKAASSTGGTLPSQPQTGAAAEEVPKTPDQERQELEAKALTESERQRRLDEAKAARELQDKDPKHQAKKWLAGVNVLLSTCTTNADTAKAASKIPGGSNLVYATNFTDHVKALTEVRTSLEAPKNVQDLAKTMADANNLLATVKADAKAWGLLHRGYYPKTKPKAVPPKTSP